MLQLQNLKLMRKLEMVKCWEYLKWNHYNLVFVGETVWDERYHVVFPANLLANVLTNKTKKTQENTQLNKTKHNKLTLN